MIVTFPLALQPAFALIRQEVRQSWGPVMALAPAAVPPCLDSLPLAPRIQSPVRACYGGGFWPVLLVHGAWSTAFPGGLTFFRDRHQLQRSERAGFWRSFSDSALQTCWEMWCSFHVSIPSVSWEGKGTVFPWRGAIDVGCKFISNQFLHFGHRHLTAIVFPWSWHCFSKAASEQEDELFCTLMQKEEKFSFLMAWQQKLFLVFSFV